MASQTVNSRIALLCFTSAELADLQETVLLKGEFLYVSDTHKIYIGDGTTALSALGTVDVDLVKYTDIVNDLTTGGASVPLSAEQGKVLKQLIDNITAGQLTVPVATGSAVGGILSGGDVTVAGNGTVTVNQAAKLATARAITLAGAVTGTANFDGTGDASITTAIGGTLQTALDAKAPLESPALTGTPTAPTAAVDTNTTQLATTAFVVSQINSVLAANNSVEFKGIVDGDTPLPSDAQVGDLYVVGAAGTYGTHTCEVGDMLICTASSDGTATWYAIQTNLVGAVTGPASAVADNIAVFDGATGKIIKDGGVSIAQLQAVATTSSNGMMSSTDKAKLEGIEAGAEVNVPGFGTISDGSGNAVATTTQDTVTITGAGGITVAAADKTVTITGTTYSDATTGASGLMSAADKTKLDGIAAGAEVNVQADWNQTTDTADDFIKNKPSVLPNPQALSVTVGSAGPVTYTGSAAQSLTITPDTVGAVAKVSGTQGNVVAFGASGAIQDTSLVAANVIQNTDTLLIQCSLS